MGRENPLTERTFARATCPNIPAVGLALRPLVVGSVHVAWAEGQVRIGIASWDGVNLEAVQAAIDAVPEDTAELRIRDAIDELSMVERKLWLAMLDLVNLERQTSGRPQVTPLQFLTLAKQRGMTG